MKKYKFEWIVFIVTVIELSAIAGFIAYQKYKFSHPKIEVYAVYHKDFPINRNEVVIPIHAGRALKHDYGMPLLNKMIGDNTGDNISLKNDRYAELTATYWVWKNSKADYVGIIHYRRSFIIQPDGLHSFEKHQHCFSYLCEVGMTAVNLHQLMQKYDVIMPATAYLPMTFLEYYNRSHIPNDLQVAVQYIREKYPEMNDTVNYVLYGHQFNSRNMFIMRKDLLDKYAAWLFDVLFHIDSKLSRETDYQSRAPGFLAERLWTIWIRHQMRTTNIKVGEMFIDTQK
ncbi:MAG: DUF4422 domain-containing protein [Alphaproteobacteria bacterium]|nr:DUF4422 domain-containing protein [Alphaproteobacteria bacterium]